MAITYQIQLVVPTIFERYLIREVEGDRLDGKPSVIDTNMFVVSFYSYSKPEYTCYVDKYTPIGRLRLKRGKKTDIKSTKLKIKYAIFGDWGEHQHGALEIVCGN